MGPTTRLEVVELACPLCAKSGHPPQLASSSDQTNAAQEKAAPASGLKVPETEGERPTFAAYTDCADPHAAPDDLCAGWSRNTTERKTKGPGFEAGACSAR